VVLLVTPFVQTPLHEICPLGQGGQAAGLQGQHSWSQSSGKSSQSVSMSPLQAGSSVLVPQVVQAAEVAHAGIVQQVGKLQSLAVQGQHGWPVALWLVVPGGQRLPTGGVQLEAVRSAGITCAVRSMLCASARSSHEESSPLLQQPVSVAPVHWPHEMISLDVAHVCIPRHEVRLCAGPSFGQHFRVMPTAGQLQPS
jgi:hypothetical protein